MSNKATAKCFCERLHLKSSNSSGSNKSGTACRSSISIYKTALKNQPQEHRKEGKSVSTCNITNITRKPVVKPKKTTKSDLTFNRNVDLEQSNLDVCKKCGDSNSKTCTNTENRRPSYSQISVVSHMGIAYKRTKTITNQTEKVPGKTKPALPSKQTTNQNILLENSRASLKQSNTQSRNAMETREQNQLQIRQIQSQTKQNQLSHTKLNQQSQTKQNQTLKMKLNQPLQTKQSKSTVQQYYKNENFSVISDSAHQIEYSDKKLNLMDTIKELPEVQTAIEDNTSTSDTEETKVFKIYSEASGFLGSRSESDELECIDAMNTDFLRKIKEFRDENYFECHSSQARLRSKGSVTSLDGHKCVYRFYLNDRLFPEPLYTDTTRKIRCVDCHLPLELKDDNESKLSNKQLNGTIQAKVKLGSGDQVQDMIVMLPVKRSMIIREKRNEPKKEENAMYFGVIKLGSDGHSVFKQNLPSDSLALKYQKGYREFEIEEELRYDSMGEGDVVIV